MSDLPQGKQTSLLQWVLSIVTAVIIAALLVAFTIMPSQAEHVDHNSSDAVQVKVSPKVISEYCPSHMQLPDSGSFGDEEFRANAGNLTSSQMFASFGSIFESQVSPITHDQDVQPLTLKAHNEATIRTASDQSANAESILETRLLNNEHNVGAVGTLASWATEGDLKGISAAQCSPLAMQSSFLVASTKTGSTQQLVIANPSDQSTTVYLEAWDNTQGKVTLATSSNIVVPANTTKTVNIAAAIPNQDAVYIRVSSNKNPIGAIIRSVSMDGLTPRGSDFALPLTEAAQSLSVPLIVKDNEKTSLMLFSEHDDTAHIDWIGADGVEQTKDIALHAGKVAIVQESFPDGIRGVLIHADHVLQASAVISATRQQQTDFALMNATQSQTYKHSAVAIPSDMNAQLVAVNTSDKMTKISLTGIDQQGNTTVTIDKNIEPKSAITVPTKELGSHTAALHATTSSNVSWGLRFTNDSVNEAKVAGLAMVGSTPLYVEQTEVSARQNPQIVK